MKFIDDEAVEAKNGDLAVIKSHGYSRWAAKQPEEEVVEVEVVWKSRNSHRKKGQIYIWSKDS